MNGEELASCYDFPFNYPKGEEIIAEARRQGKLPTLVTGLITLAATGNTNQSIGAIEALECIREASMDQRVRDVLIAKLSDSCFRDYCYVGYYSDEDDMRSPGQVSARVLGRWHIKEAIPALLAQIQNGPVLHNGVCCIDALIEIQATEAIPALTNLLGEQTKVVWGGYFTEREVIIGELAREAIEKIKASGPCSE